MSRGCSRAGACPASTASRPRSRSSPESRLAEASTTFGLDGYFAGAWRLRRRIADHRARSLGRLEGAACFVASPEGLCYRERGQLAFGPHLLEATQRYRLRIKGWRAEISFEDGRPFHSLDLGRGRAEVAHDCTPDRYRGRYRLLGPDLWTLAWHIEGPRKALSTIAWYRRATA